VGKNYNDNYNITKKRGKRNRGGGETKKKKYRKEKKRNPLRKREDRRLTLGRNDREKTRKTGWRYYTEKHNRPERGADIECRRGL